jgi:negative regulator of sigma E activity
MLRTFFLSLLLLCSLAHAQGDPWQALKQAYDASHNLNYQGVLQAQHLKDVKSMEITHAKYGDEMHHRPALKTATDRLEHELMNITGIMKRKMFLTFKIIH